MRTGRSNWASPTHAAVMMARGMTVGGLVLISACNGPHATLRRALDMRPEAPISAVRIEEAARLRFPVGTPRETVLAALPSSKPADPTTRRVWPWAESWEVTACRLNSPDICVRSADYSLGRRWYYLVRFLFVEGRLSDVRVQKETGSSGS